MTNKERQESLDKKKWLESEKYGIDMSGAMRWCDYCGNQYRNPVKHGFACTASHENRVEYCMCAKAYNRMKKGEKR